MGALTAFKIFMADIILPNITMLTFALPLDAP